MTEPADDIRLLDFGDAGRLERFGGRVLDRPHPGALGTRRDPTAWLDADLRFDREGGWTGPGAALGEWTVDVDGIPMVLRPTDAGQCGLFPEHAQMLPWLRSRVQTALRTVAAGPPTVLHLFAYTGLATLAMAAAGAAVTHVDSSRPTVAWARRNADTAGLADRPIRWIVDDAVAFTDREARRGRRYDGLVLDPPTYGHGGPRRAWDIERDLPPLLLACRAILAPGAFILLTAHTPAFGADRLAAALASSTRSTERAVEAGDLGLTSVDGRRLDLGAFVRTSGTA